MNGVVILVGLLLAAAILALFLEKNWFGLLSLLPFPKICGLFYVWRPVPNTKNR